MIASILKEFKTRIDAVIKVISEKSDMISFVSLENGNEPIVKDRINLALFTSTEMKAIREEARFNLVDTKKDVVIQKSPMKLSLNVLLIFNINSYENALGYYGQVLGYFYKNEMLEVEIGGITHKIEVLLSGFQDRDEIEIRNSFNVPGAPVLRYELKYASITGSEINERAVIETNLKLEHIGEKTQNTGSQKDS